MPGGILYRGGRKWIFNPKVWFGHAKHDMSLILMTGIVGAACCLAAGSLLRHSLRNPDVHYIKKRERAANRVNYGTQIKFLNPLGRDFDKMVNNAPKLD